MLFPGKELTKISVNTCENDGIMEEEDAILEEDGIVEEDGIIEEEEDGIA